MALQHAGGGDICAVAAHAEGRVGFRAVREEWQRLVRPGVEGANHHFLAGKSIKDASVGLDLFGDGWFSFSFQEAKFGAEQAHALGTGSSGLDRVLGAAHVG